MICDLKEHQELTITSKDCDDSGSSDEHPIYIGSNASETEVISQSIYNISQNPHSPCSFCLFTKHGGVFKRYLICLNSVRI